MDITQKEAEKIIKGQIENRIIFADGVELILWTDEPLPQKNKDALVSISSKEFLTYIKQDPEFIHKNVV